MRKEKTGSRENLERDTAGVPMVKAYRISEGITLHGNLSPHYSLGMFPAVCSGSQNPQTGWSLQLCSLQLTATEQKGKEEPPQPREENRQPLRKFLARPPPYLDFTPGNGFQNFCKPAGCQWASLL